MDLLSFPLCRLLFSLPFCCLPRSLCLKNKKKDVDLDSYLFVVRSKYSTKEEIPFRILVSSQLERPKDAPKDEKKRSGKKTSACSEFLDGPITVSKWQLGENESNLTTRNTYSMDVLIRADGASRPGWTGLDSARAALNARAPRPVPCSSLTIA